MPERSLLFRGMHLYYSNMRDFDWFSLSHTFNCLTFSLNRPLRRKLSMRFTTAITTEIENVLELENETKYNALLKKK